MTPADVKGVAESAAREAVREVLLTLGLDVTAPIAAQADFAIMREVGKLARDAEFRKDLEAIRAWRLALAQIRSKGMLAAVGVLVSGGAALLWSGFKVKIGQ
jgi:uncharacterized membrane protein